MGQGWSGRGPWVITATSTDVHVSGAVSELARISGTRVAAVVLGPGETMTWPPGAVLHVIDADQMNMERVQDLIGAMARAYDLVLVSGGPGLLVPIGTDGWTLADLAVRLPAPVLVVTGSGPGTGNHTSPELDALTGRGIPVSTVTITDGGLSLQPARPTVETAPAVDAEEPGKTTTNPIRGEHLVLALLGVFAVMVLAACGLAFCFRTTSTTTSSYGVQTEEQPDSALRTIPPAEAASQPAPPVRTRSGTDVCPESAGQVTVARPSRATIARVDRVWQRIERWLAAKAPVSHRSLRPPAAAAAIDMAQRRMSVAFPDDLVASLLRHDGASDFDLPPFYTPDPVDYIYKDWQVTCSVLANDEGDWTELWWHADLVPFADAGDGGSLVVDQRPGRNGRVGEFYPEEGTHFEGWPASITELLEKTAASLESGQTFEGLYRPQVADGRLDWEIVR